MAKEKTFAEDIKQAKPDLIFTIGTEATLYAKQNLPAYRWFFPWFSTRLKRHNQHRWCNQPQYNRSGLKISVEQQFARLKEALPKLKR